MTTGSSLNILLVKEGDLFVGRVNSNGDKLIFDDDGPTLSGVDGNTNSLASAVGATDN